MFGTAATLIGLAIAGTSTAMSVKGQLAQGKAAKDAGLANQRAAEATAKVAESRAEQLEFNARAAEEQAADAVQRGAEEEGRFRSSVRGLIGSQRAGFAGSGVLVDSGSARDVQEDARYLGDLDALTIRANALREQAGFKTEAEDLRMGADVARQEAKAARDGGQYAAAAGAQAGSSAKWGAAGTILGSGSSLLLQRYGWPSSSKATSSLDRTRALAMKTYNTFPGGR